MLTTGKAIFFAYLIQLNAYHCIPRNVYIKCRWDNERLHESGDPPLYSMWTSPTAEDLSRVESSPDPETHVKIMCEKQSPPYKAIMQHILSGVSVNDLLQVS